MIKNFHTIYTFFVKIIKIICLFFVLVTAIWWIINYSTYKEFREESLVYYDYSGQKQDTNILTRLSCFGPSDVLSNYITQEFDYLSYILLIESLNKLDDIDSDLVEKYNTSISEYKNYYLNNQSLPDDYNYFKKFCNAESDDKFDIIKEEFNHDLDILFFYTLSQYITIGLIICLILYFILKRLHIIR